MRTIGFAGIVLAACLSLPQPARSADVPGGKSTKAALPVSVKATVGVFDFASDNDWYRVVLRPDTDYSVSVRQMPDRHFVNMIAVRLRDATGRVLASDVFDAGDKDTDDEGFTYHTRRGGLYFLEYEAQLADVGAKYAARVAGDCRDGIKTGCSLLVGRTHHGLIAYQADADWFRTTLTAGARYDIGLLRTGGTGPSVAGYVADSRGNLVLDGLGGGAKRFVPAASGTYYVAVVSGDSYYGDVLYSLRIANAGPPP